MLTRILFWHCLLSFTIAIAQHRYLTLARYTRLYGLMGLRSYTRLSPDGIKLSPFTGYRRAEEDQ
jgi:hypothetical protein